MLNPKYVTFRYIKKNYVPRRVKRSLIWNGRSRYFFLALRRTSTCTFTDCPPLLSPPCKDGFGSDTDEIGSECHLLPHFNPDTNANADLIEYEYKTDSSNTDSNPDTFSIWNIKLSRVSFYFVNNFIVDQNHYISRE